MAIAPRPAYINSTVITVGGLAEFTWYYFQVYAGDETGYDVNFFTPPPSAQTLVKRKPPTSHAHLDHAGVDAR